MSDHGSLNHIYRTVWNEALGAMVAVAEITTGGSRSSGASSRSRTRLGSHPLAANTLAALSLAIAIGWGAMLPGAIANPAGGVAIHGQVSTSTPAPNQLKVVTQNGVGTSHSAINWQSFSIPAGSTTSFVQPSATSTAINRVVTNTPSALFGSLSSNGRLVLVNQSGIAVGAGAVIDTAGFTASALRMSDADALAGRLRFGEANAVMGSGAGITVRGRITARDGDVVLIAPNIDVGTSALVQAPNGSTVLAAGQQVEITGRGLEGITLLVQAPADRVRNLGRLEGDAAGIFAGTLRHSGEIQATAASVEGGKVVLKALDLLELGGRTTAKGLGGMGGVVLATGREVQVLAGAVVDASAPAGGGEVLIGGGAHGKDGRINNAQSTSVAGGATIRADATSQGAGGAVVVWSDNNTQFAGAISAQGGPLGGNGGWVETSGASLKIADSARVSTAAAMGLVGTWLLDPPDFTIAASGGDITGATLSTNLG